MKISIESSFYLLLLAIFCAICIDFVAMNQKVTKVNEVSQYVSDYTEVHGTVAESNTLDANTLAAIRNYADANNMSIDCTYDSETNNYVYYNVKLNYNLGTAFFKLNNTHSFASLVRVAKEDTP